MLGSRGLAILIATSVSPLACDESATELDPEARVAGTYDLQTVDSQALPIPWISGFTTMITAGTLELTRDREYRMAFDLSAGSDVSSSGTYSLIGVSEIELLDPCGTVDAQGCRQIKYGGRLHTDSLSLDWGQRSLSYRKRQN